MTPARANGGGRGVVPPPLKSQGIKTKFAPWIAALAPPDFCGAWVEPFMGTGAVAFNLPPRRALLADINPHLIAFYQAMADERITPAAAERFLRREGATLAADGEAHYYRIRERFNERQNPLDFLFLNRAGFNGLIRFNRGGRLNVPFCRKPKRFARPYVTKIVNQVAHVARWLRSADATFQCQPFAATIAAAGKDDIIYCDPPYIDRHADYHNGWGEEDERGLWRALSDFPGKFILSTWHHNDYRRNVYVDSLWKDFNVITRPHFYHVGGGEKNRRPIVEAIVMNYDAAAPERGDESPLFTGVPV